jgi:hypothetical protein
MRKRENEKPYPKAKSKRDHVTKQDSNPNDDG